MANKKRGAHRFGRYVLPIRAISVLRDRGVTPKTIELYTIKEFESWRGFGAAAADAMRQVRAKDRAEGNRSLTKPAEMNMDDPDDPFGFGDLLQRQEEITNFDEAAEEIDSDVPAEGLVAPRVKGMIDGKYDLSDPMDKKKALALAHPTRQTDPARLILNLGEEHGLRPRHLDWLRNVVKNAPADLGVPTLDRLVVKLIAHAYALDPTKGGTIGVSGSDGEPDTTPRVKA